MGIAHYLARIYWRVLQPTTLGSRCLVLDGRSVLLVRHTNQSSWYLPGGGVKRGETFAEAARREVLEECGLRIANLKLFHLYLNRFEGKIDHVAVFTATRLEGAPQVASTEVAEVGFFPLDSPPPGTSSGTRQRIREYLEGCPSDRW